MSQSGVFSTGATPPGGVVATVQGNSGGVVSPNGSDNIFIVGDGTTVDIVGNPATHTLTVSAIGGGGGITSITGDTGAAQSGPAIDLNALSTAGSSVSFSGSANTISLNVTDVNNNTSIGLNAGNNAITGTNNVFLGSGAASAITTGLDNVVIGGLNAGANLQGANNNTFVGANVAANLNTGGFNTFIGKSAGAGYTTNEASNIAIGYGISGNPGDSNVLTIGRGTGTGQGQLNQTFIAGIYGMTPATADGIPVFIGSDGQLGTVGTGGGGGITSIAGDTGGAQSGPTIDLDASTTAGSSVSFSGATNVISLNVTDGNRNTLIGSGAGNTGITGQFNVGAGAFIGASLVTGNSNSFLGDAAGVSLVDGAGNVFLGTGAGAQYTTTESYNIIIGTGIFPLVGENNVLRIGSGTGSGTGQLLQSFVGGIYGIVPGAASPLPVYIDSNGQLGTGAAFITPVTNVNTTPYVVLPTDNFLAVDCSAQPITIQLPDTAVVGQSFTIKDSTGSSLTNNITVTTVSGSTLIDGLTSSVLNTPYASISVMGNGNYEIF